MSVPLALALLLASALPAQVYTTPRPFIEAGANSSWATFAEGGLALYFDPNLVGWGHVAVMRRPTLNGPWGPSSIVYSPAPAALGPRVSGDGLELFAYAFVGATRQIHYSRRSSLAEMFAPLQPVQELASSTHRGPGCVSRDGLTLYYWEGWGGPLPCGFATRPNLGGAFVDQGLTGPRALGWVSDDGRVGLSWGLFQFVRPSVSTAFGLERTLGLPTGTGSGGPTFLPSTGELIYWRDPGSGLHELVIAMRQDTLADYSLSRPGGSIDLDIYGRPVELWALFAGTQRGSVPLPPFGIFGLGGTIVFAGLGAMPSTGLTWSPVLDPYPQRFRAPIPMDQNLIGLMLHWQALCADRVMLSRGALTNIATTSILAQ